MPVPDCAHSHPDDPDAGEDPQGLSPHARLSRVATLLARGLCRLHAEDARGCSTHREHQDRPSVNLEVRESLGPDREPG